MQNKYCTPQGTDFIHGEDATHPRQTAARALAPDSGDHQPRLRWYIPHRFAAEKDGEPAAYIASVDLCTGSTKIGKIP
jgi:hypothetical protein